MLFSRRLQQTLITSFHASLSQTDIFRQRQVEPPLAVVTLPPRQGALALCQLVSLGVSRHLAHVCHQIVVSQRPQTAENSGQSLHVVLPIHEDSP
jgi:hypothetical protein